MFFNAPQPDTYAINNIENSKLSYDISKSSESSSEESLPTPPPAKSHNLKNKKSVPLTRENLKRHNKLMSKKEIQKNLDLDINKIKSETILSDFNKKVTIKNLVDFIKYFVNKKIHIPEDEKNDIIFSLFEKIISLYTVVQNFNKKELVSTYVYLNRICHQYDNLRETLKNFNEYKDNRELPVVLALSKAININGGNNPEQNKFFQLIKKTNQKISSYISYKEYEYYSKKYF